MKRLIWIIPVIIAFPSCKGQPKRKAAEENKLSVLIFQDKVIVYNGIFDKNTAYKKYLHTEPEKLKEAIEQNQRKYGSRSEILLKIAAKDDGTDHGDLIRRMYNISEQNSGPDLKIADVTETEAQFFSIFAFKKSFLDSLRKPIALKLNMPKDPESESEKKIPARHAFTCLIISEDSIFCYRGDDIPSGTFYSLTGTNSFRARLKEVKKETGDSLMVILKPTGAATYKNTIDILDEMTINAIRKYAFVQPGKAEKEALHIKE